MYYVAKKTKIMHTFPRWKFMESGVHRDLKNARVHLKELEERGLKDYVIIKEVK